MRLSSEVWVFALIRRVHLAGASATLVRRGDATGGAVLVKARHPGSGEFELLSEAVRGDGDTVWMRPVASRSEAEIDAYIDRAAHRDPDLWVVEIEAAAREFLTEPIDE